MLILAAILAILVYGMIAAMLGTILPDLSKRYSLTPRQNGTIALCQAIGLVLASLATGPLIDNQGKKAGLVLGLAVITIALALLPSSRGFAHIAVNLLLLGLGGGVIVTAANALASDVAPDRRGTALNLLNLFFGLGGLATPFIAANLLGRNATRLCYLVAALTGVTLLVNIATPMPQPNGIQNFVWSQIGIVTGRPALWLMALFIFLYVSCEVGVWNWLVQHLIAQGIAESQALNVLSLGFALGILIGRVAIAPVLITVSPLTVTLAASVMMAITTYLMIQTRRARTAWILVFLAGSAWHRCFPPRSPSSATLPTHDRDRHGNRDHFRLAGAGREFAHHRLHRRRRFEAAEEGPADLPVMAVIMTVVNLALHLVVR